MDWYLKVLKQYSDFGGRARRKEYWMFVLFNVIFAIAASIIDSIIGINIFMGLYGIFYTLYMLAVLIPSIAVSVRRLHDIGKSGLMLLVALIPIIGWIWILILMIKEGEPRENQYGPNPKGEFTSTMDAITN
ncbi:MAG: DUF805 domain-containing protein [Candidatus Kapaibacterium sp.]|jgi:uncharacterized membrane protein YhaH (DUF805 family)